MPDASRTLSIALEPGRVPAEMSMPTSAVGPSLSAPCSPLSVTSLPAAFAAEVPFASQPTSRASLQGALRAGNSLRKFDLVRSGPYATK